MNQQTFIERAPKSGSKTLNTVDIQCLSMSLCRHGRAVARAVSAKINAFISGVSEYKSPFVQWHGGSFLFISYNFRDCSRWASSLVYYQMNSFTRYSRKRGDGTKKN